MFLDAWPALGPASELSPPATSSPTRSSGGSSGGSPARRDASGRTSGLSNGSRCDMEQDDYDPCDACSENPFECGWDPSECFAAHLEELREACGEAFE